MSGKSPAAALLGLSVAMAGGCVSGTMSPSTMYVPDDHVSSALVLARPVAGDFAAADPGAAEYRRNDTRLNVGGSPVIHDHEWTEIRTRDHMRTSNGRPREFSTTTVRTLRRRVGD